MRVESSRSHLVAVILLLHCSNPDSTHSLYRPTQTACWRTAGGVRRNNNRGSQAEGALTYHRGSNNSFIHLIQWLIIAGLQSQSFIHYLGWLSGRCLTSKQSPSFLPTMDEGLLQPPPTLATSNLNLLFSHGHTIIFALYKSVPIHHQRLHCFGTYLRAAALQPNKSISAWVRH